MHRCSGTCFHRADPSASTVANPWPTFLSGQPPCSSVRLPPMHLQTGMLWNTEGGSPMVPIGEEDLPAPILVSGWALQTPFAWKDLWLHQGGRSGAIHAGAHWRRGPAGPHPGEPPARRWGTELRHHLSLGAATSPHTPAAAALQARPSHVPGAPATLLPPAFLQGSTAPPHMRPIITCRYAHPTLGA